MQMQVGKEYWNVLNVLTEMHQEGIGFCIILSEFYRNVGLNTLHISRLSEIQNSEVGADLKQFPPDVLPPERQFDSFINFVGNSLSHYNNLLSKRTVFNTWFYGLVM